MAKGWAFIIDVDGTVLPPVTASGVLFVPAEANADTWEQAKAWLAAGGKPKTQAEVKNVVLTSTSPSVPAVEPALSTAITSTETDLYRPGVLNGIGISWDAPSHECRLWFDNVGGAAALQWIVTTLTGKTIAGAGWANSRVYQAGATDFLLTDGFPQYTSTARLSPAISGTAGIVSGTYYLVGLKITTGGQTYTFVGTFKAPSATTSSGPVALSLQEKSGGTIPDNTNTGGGSTSSAIAEDYSGGTAGTPEVGTDMNGTAFTNQSAPVNQ